jgi:hypothetical protein
MTESLKASAFQEHYALSLNLGRKRRAARRIALSDQTSETKLKEYEKSLTLAQKLDLVAKPPTPLSVSQWDVVKSQSASCAANCPICLESFKLRDQIILPCSHVYHRVCFTYYIRYLKSESCTGRCAICREPAYDFTEFDGGRIAYLNECALRLQKLWRAAKARASLKPAPGSFMCRRKILARMKVISSRIDRQRRDTEETMKHFLTHINPKAEQDLRDTRASLQVFNQLREGREVPVLNSDQRWTSALLAAIARDDSQCPICFESLTPASACLLSCSHLFHIPCISACEVISRSCPVCRQVYTKIPFSEFGNYPSLIFSFQFNLE